MERSISPRLENEIQLYVNAFNSNQLLSDEEQAEIFDHLLSETLSLQELGLDESEAFLVSKKRFGDAPMIQAEYQKAKPIESIIKKVIFILLGYFSISILMNVVSVLTNVFACTALYTSLADAFGEYIFIQKINLFITPSMNHQIIPLIGFQVVLWGVFLTLVYTKIEVFVSTFKKYIWAIPFVFFIFQLLRIFSLPFLTSVTTLEVLGYIQFSHSIIYFIMMIGLVVLTSRYLWKRNNKLVLG